MIDSRKSTAILLIAAFSFAMVSALIAAPTARKPLRIEGKTGAVCIILPYDFDSSEKEFPKLGLPDNALLALAVEDGDFAANKLTVVQGGKTYSPTGVFGYYVWGSFYAIYYDPAFNKYQPFEVRYGDKSRQLAAADIARLSGSAKSVGQRAWVDPVTDATILSTPPISLPDLLARGRALEYTNEALDLRSKGGLSLIRATAMKALEEKDYQRAACLAAEAIRWSAALEPPELRPVGNFLDWVAMARAFFSMGQPLAASRAYDEALKIRKEKVVQQERQDAWNAYSKKGGDNTCGPYRESLSEAELAVELHGQIPIPANERGVIRDGVSADGVFIGDTKERIRAQCGQPSESFSGMLLYLDHPSCPEAIFFTAADRAYAIRSVRGKTAKGLSIGDAMSKVIEAYGAPDRKEAGPDPKKKSSGRWIYLKQKIAFVDLNGTGKIEAIDIFDYSLNQR